MCLSTCNRTELYVAAPDIDAAEQAAVAALAELEPEVEPALYRLHDHAAALHLFRVAAGLDSLVPGEGEIVGQVRAAHDAGTTGPLLDRVFRQALHVGRKVRAQTAIGETPASVSSAAAALAEQVFGDLEGRSILLVGAGKISEQAAKNLLSRRARIAFVANRTLDHAADLAERFGAEPLPLDRLEEQLATTDVVVSSTSAPGYVLDAPLVRACAQAAPRSPAPAHRPRRAARSRPGDPRPRRLLPLRHRRPAGDRGRDAHGASRRDRAGRGDRRRRVARSSASGRPPSRSSLRSRRCARVRRRSAKQS